MSNSKVIIVTGSSSGIGARTAQRFAEEGASAVVITGRRRELLDKVKNECEAANHGKTKIKVVCGNITDEQVQRELIDGTVKEFGRLDVLINNAGIAMPPIPSSKCPIEVFDNVFNVNVRSVISLTQLALPHLVAYKGNIVNVSTVAAVKPFPPAFYGMSKRALEQYSKCLAVELGPSGVRVNVVRFGFIAGTDFFRDYNKDVFNLKHINHASSSVPLQRTGTVEEAANIILYLASGNASFMTGSVVIADGGQLCYST